MGNETSCCASKDEGHETKNMTVEDMVSSRKMNRRPNTEIPPLNVESGGGQHLEYSAKQYQSGDQPRITPTDGDYKSTGRGVDVSQANMGSLEDRPQVTLPDGGVYTGQWLGEKRQGKGVLRYSDGAVYEGRFTSLT